MSLIPLDITQAFSTDLESGVWTYASVSTSVLSPAGFPTVRLGPDTTWRQTRELNLNYNPNWVKGLVKPGDRIIWRIKARTDLEGGLDVVNTPYTGGRLGLDFLVMIPDYQNNVDGRPHNYDNRNGIEVSGDYYAPDGNYLPDNTPVSYFQVPYGRGWTTIEWNVVIPNNIFTKDSGGLDLGGSFQIDGMAAWIDVREIDIEAPVYFGDPEFYLNPTRNITLPYNDVFLDTLNWAKIKGSWTP